MCTATNPRKLCKKREWCGQNCWFQIWLWPKSHYPVPRPKVLSHAVNVNYARDNLFLLCARCLMSIGTIHFHLHSSHPLWSVQMWTLLLLLSTGNMKPQSVSCQSLLLLISISYVSIMNFIIFIFIKIIFLFCYKFFLIYAKNLGSDLSLFTHIFIWEEEGD